MLHLLYSGFGEMPPLYTFLILIRLYLLYQTRTCSYFNANESLSIMLTAKISDA